MKDTHIIISPSIFCLGKKNPSHYKSYLFEDPSLVLSTYLVMELNTTRMIFMLKRYFTIRRMLNNIYDHD